MTGRESDGVQWEETKGMLQSEDVQRLNVIANSTGCDSCQTDLLIAIFKLKVSFERKDLLLQSVCWQRRVLGEDLVIESECSERSIH